jgi:adenylate cyclase class 1
MQMETFNQNKKTFLQYNNFRKQIFTDLAPKDSEVILYMLPWLLSQNDPAVPGYIPEMITSFTVHGIEKDDKIRKREPDFRRMLKISSPLPVPAGRAGDPQILGIYTIGSIGTISQTASSDCDIWICVDPKDFGEKRFGELIEKTNLIKGWLDNHISLPVYFFICDVHDIRDSNFGSVDRESAGSTQRNTLKEEFYRTAVMIAGRIPLWWLCFETDAGADYALVLDQYRRGVLGEDDCIDLGPLESVESEEYFGAALWQFNKALTNPLKSIIKMLLLEMLLVSSKNNLLCHQFRQFILGRKNDLDLMDPSMFTMDAVLRYSLMKRPGEIDFIKKCFYLRYELKLHLKMTMKEILARVMFERYPIERHDVDELNTFNEWPLQSQTEFGRKIFALLAGVYNSISRMDRGAASSVNPHDLTIVGRKLAVCLEKKPNKISFCHKPVRSVNVSALTFTVDQQRLWTVSTKGGATLLSGSDIVYCLAYLIWNGIYQPYLVTMTPNTTSVTLQEIQSLAESIRKIFGTYDSSDIDFGHFLEPEKMVRMLIVVSFEGHRQNKDENDLGVIYQNSWGEIFARRFSSPLLFRDFVRKGGSKFSQTEIFYYIQRNCLYYEKIIERTKAMVMQSLAMTKRQSIRK